METTDSLNSSGNVCQEQTLLCEEICMYYMKLCMYSQHLFLVVFYEVFLLENGKMDLFMFLEQAFLF